LDNMINDTETRAVGMDEMDRLSDTQRTDLR
jgi:hypothetical protein